MFQPYRVIIRSLLSSTEVAATLVQTWGFISFMLGVLIK
jgi:hypothetical protein